MVAASMTKVMTVRLAESTARQVREFGESIDEGLGGAMRILIEAGLTQMDDIDLESLKSLQFNAHVRALQELNREIDIVVENLQEHISEVLDEGI